MFLEDEDNDGADMDMSSRLYSDDEEEGSLSKKDVSLTSEFVLIWCVSVFFIYLLKLRKCVRQRCTANWLLKELS